MNGSLHTWPYHPTSNWLNFAPAISSLPSAWCSRDTRRYRAIMQTRKRRSGLIGSPSGNDQPPLVRRSDHPDEAARTARALFVWHEARAAAGTIVEACLASRSLVSPPLQCLRFDPARPHPTGQPHPAMVALVECCGRGPVGIHPTYLRPDGSGKASVRPAKASLGQVAGGAVRLGSADPGDWLVIAEGLETALSGAQSCRLRRRASKCHPAA
jgi:hypothetical protein